MADTSYLRRQVEDHVRDHLSRKYGINFRRCAVKLLTGGTHEFDAVSDDLSIVAAITAAGGRTASGRIPSGKIKSAEADLYYLSLVPAKIRLLVLTSREFYEIMEHRLEGCLASGISLELVSLPPEIENEASSVRMIASKEVAPLSGRAKVKS